MEKKFLCYLLYIALVDIRERSLENGDNACFWLCNLLHNIPLVLAEGDHELEDSYKRICESVEHDNRSKWLENRKQEFYSNYPEFKGQGLK